MFLLLVRDKPPHKINHPSQLDRSRCASRLSCHPRELTKVPFILPSTLILLQIHIIVLPRSGRPQRSPIEPSSCSRISATPLAPPVDDDSSAALESSRLTFSCSSRRWPEIRRALHERKPSDDMTPALATPTGKVLTASEIAIGHHQAFASLSQGPLGPLFPVG